MAVIKGKGSVTLSVDITLTEAEARALFFLSEFGGEQVTKTLGERISMEFRTAGDHRLGMESLLDSAKVLGNVLNRTTDARKVFEKGKIKT